jgi:hypothetical protein
MSDELHMTDAGNTTENKKKNAEGGTSSVKLSREELRITQLGYSSSVA